MEKRKILLVDDDKDLVDLYSEVLENANFEVLQASDGVEGLDKATKELPDLIFTGIVMPRMDGFSMIELLQKTVMTANIPIVISSHMGREEDRLRANTLGVKDFIVRGTTTPIEVINRINNIFAKTSDEYVIEINPLAFDAQQLLKDLGLQDGLKCPKCQEKLELKMKLINASERKFEARIVCPKCG